MRVISLTFVVALAVMFGMYRDARGTANARADTIASLSLRVSALESRVSRDEVTLAVADRKVNAVCFWGKVVSDVTVSPGFGNAPSSVSPRYVYC